MAVSVNAPQGLPVPAPVSPWNHKPTVPFQPWNQDPGYVNAQNQQRQRDAQAAALWNQMRQSALYRYNGAGNPYATTAVLKQQDADHTRGYLNSLAARGILSSGETGYQAGQEAKWYGQQMYTAQNALNDLLGSLQQQYLSTVGSDADATNNALNQAWQNYLANPSLYPRPPQPGAWGGAQGLTGGGGGSNPTGKQIIGWLK